MLAFFNLFKERTHFPEAPKKHRHKKQVEIMIRSFSMLLLLAFFIVIFNGMPLKKLHAAEIPDLKISKMEKLHPRDGMGNTIQKLEQGETVRIACLGGSITAANGWRPKTTEWFRKTFPKANIVEVDAAIGGTGSDLGVFRLKHDILQHQPDLLFVEFAVNDGGASPENIWRAMEGIVRQTWKTNPKTDIVYVYTISEALAREPREGTCNRSMSAMEQLADFYGIPSINFAVTVLQLEKDGKLLFTGETAPEEVILFSNDSVHPLDAGHKIYAETVAESVTAMKNIKATDHSAKLAKTWIADNWEAAKLVPITPAMLEGTWNRMGENAQLYQYFGNRLGEIWHSNTPGSKMTFRFKGSQAKVYDLLGPDGGQVVITVDGKTNDQPIPRFDSYCTYHRLATLWLAGDLDANQVHTVTVEIHPEQPSRQPVAFRLADAEKELAEVKYQGTNVWFGQLMLLGDLVK